MIEVVALVALSLVVFTYVKIRKRRKLGSESKALEVWYVFIDICSAIAILLFLSVVFINLFAKVIDVLF